MVPAKIDLVKATKKLKGEYHEFHIDLNRWRMFKTRHKLEWQKVRFEKASQPGVPDQRGIYAFTIELEPSKLPVHGYIMYVGITGHESNNANLRKRFGQYLGHQRSDTGRARMSFLLQNWRGDLFFNFVPLPSSSVDLKKLETAFISAVIPPVNRTDYEADLAPQIIAAF